MSGGRVRGRGSRIGRLCAVCALALVATGCVDAGSAETTSSLPESTTSSSVTSTSQVTTTSEATTTTHPEWTDGELGIEIVVDITLERAGKPGTFIASGEAVDAGLVCDRGTTIEYREEFYHGPPPPEGQFQWETELTCDDGSGRISIAAYGRNVAEYPDVGFDEAGTWVLVGGKGVYGGMIGGGDQTEEYRKNEHGAMLCTNWYTGTLSKPPDGASDPADEDEASTTTSSAASGASAPQLPALVAHFPLDGSGENVADPSGEWDGTVHGAVPTEDRFGNAEGAYAFDESGDSLEFIEVEGPTGEPGESAPALDTETITIATWFRADMLEDEERPLWWWHTMVSFGIDGHVLALNGRGAVLGGVQGWNEGTYVALGTHLDGEWHHVAMTKDESGTLTIYVDGRASDLIGGGGIVEAGQTAREAVFKGVLWIGADIECWEPFIGALDDVRIYNYALTPAEILDLYEG